MHIVPSHYAKYLAQKSWYPQDTRKSKKRHHRRKCMTEHNDSMSWQFSENQSIMDLPARYTADSRNAHPSTVDGSPIQEMDQSYEELSNLSHQRLVAAYVDCMQEREIAQMENLSLHSEVEQSRQKVFELEQRLAEQESVVRDAQESAFALMASNISIAENDDKICSKLRMLRMQWKNFAKTWASKSLAPIRDEKYLLLRKMIDAWVASDEDQSHDGIWANDNDRKAPSILLNAVLAHFISGNIIRKPFTAVFNLQESTESVRNDNSTIMNSLDRLYALKIKGAFNEK